MTHLGYIAAAWGSTLGVLGIYALRLLRRGRRLAPRVPIERRRWLGSESSQRSGDR